MKSKISVMKFGGTSLADPDRVKRAAERIKVKRSAGWSVVVVVSAPGHTTDELLETAGKVSQSPDPRELDVLLAAGEQISIALVCMALKSLGVDAVSLTGPQAGIMTTAAHSHARITHIDARRLRAELGKGRVAVVAGFQGLSPRGDIATLGRGGSDLTAVALAAELKAAECQIYTDVEGVYTCDPRTEPRARKLKDVSHEELIELAAAGAAVMQARSVEVARRRAVPFEVLSSFSESPGTVVHSTPPGGAVEKAVVTSIALSPGQAEVLMAGLADPVGATAAVFAALSRAGIKTDLPVQWEDGDGRRQISVLVPAADRRRIMDMIRPVKKAIGISHLSSENGLATVSIIGTGVRSDPSVIAKVFEALKKEGTAIRRFVASEIRLSCVVSEDRARRAASALHAAFGLGGERGA